jgi:hypothetical protein
MKDDGDKVYDVYTYTGRVEIAAACDMLTYGTMLSSRFYAFFTFLFFVFVFIVVT